MQNLWSLTGDPIQEQVDDGTSKLFVERQEDG